MEVEKSPNRKPFFFCMTVCHRRTGSPVGRTCGVVFAETAEEAEEIAWEKYGNIYSYKLWVEEVPEDGAAYFM